MGGRESREGEGSMEESKDQKIERLEREVERLNRVIADLEHDARQFPTMAEFENVKDAEMKLREEMEKMKAEWEERFLPYPLCEETCKGVQALRERENKALRADLEEARKERREDQGNVIRLTNENRELRARVEELEGIIEKWVSIEASKESLRTRVAELEAEVEKLKIDLRKREEST